MNACTPSETVRAAVTSRGVAHVARQLGLSRSTVGSYLAGVCRPGTALLVEARAERLLEQPAALPLQPTGTAA